MIVKKSNFMRYNEHEVDPEKYTSHSFPIKLDESDSFP